jgi:hypothetical protein
LAARRWIACPLVFFSHQFFVAALLAKVMNIGGQIGDLLVGIVGVLRHGRLQIWKASPHYGSDQVPALVTPD